jgi:hypothetical protein
MANVLREIGGGVPASSDVEFCECADLRREGDVDIVDTVRLRDRSMKKAMISGNACTDESSSGDPEDEGRAKTRVRAHAKRG